jgi:polyisoprenoid-binding protein YceI
VYLVSLTATATAPATVTYTLDPSRSKFMAHASPSGLLWFKGHGHHLDAGDFTGTVELTPQTITPASLRLVVKAASLHETGADFTESQKQIINKELREIVLHPDQYPEIVFQSTNATAKPAKTGGGYDVKLTGNLTLHGVTRPVEIPATVTLNLVRVSGTVKFEFDIVGRRQ